MVRIAARQLEKRQMPGEMAVQLPGPVIIRQPGFEKGSPTRRVAGFEKPMDALVRAWAFRGLPANERSTSLVPTSTAPVSI